MGWTGTYYDKNPKGKERIALAITQEGMNWTDKERGIKSEVIDSALVGNTVYLAVHYTNTEKGINKVYASVILTAYENRRGGEFLTKEMSESMGPYCYDCPKRILDKLSAPDNECAENWRKACAEKRAKKAADALAKIDFGESIKLATGEVLHAYKHRKTKVFVNWLTRTYYTQKQVRAIGWEAA